MADSTLRVRGHAVVSGVPDEAEVSIKLSVLDMDAGDALAEVTQRSEELGKILDEMQILREHRSTTGVSVREETEWDSKAGKYYHRGYLARNTMQVRVTDPSKIGRLVESATVRARAEVGQLTWVMALDNPARTAACREAAAEARRKAEAYAGALGVRLGVVLEVFEPGMGGSRTVQMLHSSLGPADASEDYELELEPGEMDVSAGVDVTFRLEQA